MQADVLPEVSVVVPCRGHAEQLAGCLTGLERQVLDAPYEVIVVDISPDEQGLMLWTCGAAPTKLRMLLPVNVTDEELEAGFAILEKLKKDPN